MFVKLTLKNSLMDCVHILNVKPLVIHLVNVTEKCLNNTLIHTHVLWFMCWWVWFHSVFWSMLSAGDHWKTHCLKSAYLKLVLNTTSAHQKLHQSFPSSSVLLTDCKVENQNNTICTYNSVVDVKLFKITISTVARTSGNCNLIGHVGCYDCMVVYMYQLIIAILISLSCLIDIQRSRIIF